MQSGEIPDLALKSSSDYNQYFGAARSRLNKQTEGSYYGGWASKHADVGQWLQIDLGKITKITRIATQGRYDANWWVTKYKLSYSDGGRFKSYKNGEVSFYIPLFFKKIIKSDGLICIRKCQRTKVRIKPLIIELHPEVTLYEKVIPY